MPKSSRRNRSGERWSSWTLWEKWVLATMMGELVGLASIMAVSPLLDTIDTAGKHTALLAIGILEGAILGFCQWLVLRRYVHHIGWWVATTAVGGVIAWLIGLMVSVLMAILYTVNADDTASTAFAAGVMLLGAGVGTVLGFAQWLVLKTHIRKAAWWILANAFAWSLGLLIAFAGAGMMQLHGSNIMTALAGAATGVALGTVVGAITGTALVWLLKPGLLSDKIP